MTPERKAYSPGEVAKMLGISRSGVYNMIRVGILPAFPIGKRQIRIPRQAVDELLARGGVVPQNEGGDESDDHQRNSA